MRNEYAIFSGRRGMVPTIVVAALMGLQACGGQAPDAATVDPVGTASPIVAVANDAVAPSAGTAATAPEIPAISATPEPASDTAPTTPAPQPALADKQPNPQHDANPSAGPTATAPTPVVPEPAPVVPAPSEPALAAPPSPTPNTHGGPADAIDRTGSGLSAGPVRKVILKERWSVQTQSAGGDIRVGPDHVFAMIGNDKAHASGIVAVDKETGTPVWRKPRVHRIFVHKDVVVTWPPFQVLDAATGKMLWQRKVNRQYFSMAAAGELLAFVTGERVPERYRLTVAELRTGNELYFHEKPERGTWGTEDQLSLWFDHHGLWVGHKRLPEDPETRATLWSEVVHSTSNGRFRFPYHSVRNERYTLTLHENEDWKLWDREAPDEPVWVIKQGRFKGDSGFRITLDSASIFHQKLVSIRIRPKSPSGESSDDDWYSFRRVSRHAIKDGSLVWQRDDIDFRRRHFEKTPFGLLFGGGQGEGMEKPYTGPAALDHDGREIEVVGTFATAFVYDGGAIYAHDEGRLTRYDITTEP